MGIPFVTRQIHRVALQPQGLRLTLLQNPWNHCMSTPVTFLSKLNRGLREWMFHILGGWYHRGPCVSVTAMIARVFSSFIYYIINVALISTMRRSTAIQEIHRYEITKHSSKLVIMIARVLFFVRHEQIDEWRWISIHHRTTETVETTWSYDLN